MDRRVEPDRRDGQQEVGPRRGVGGEWGEEPASQRVMDRRSQEWMEPDQQQR